VIAEHDEAAVAAVAGESDQHGRQGDGEGQAAGDLDVTAVEQHDRRDQQLAAGHAYQCGEDTDAPAKTPTIAVAAGSRSGGNIRSPAESVSRGLAAASATVLGGALASELAPVTLGWVAARIRLFRYVVVHAARVDTLLDRPSTGFAGAAVVVGLRSHSGTRSRRALWLKGLETLAGRCQVDKGRMGTTLGARIHAEPAICGVCRRFVARPGWDDWDGDR
jgi:hypothetical protein